VLFCRIAPQLRALESSALPLGVREISLAVPPSEANDPDREHSVSEALASVVREVRPALVHAGPVQACGYPAALAGGAPLSVVSWGSDLLVEAYRSAQSGDRARVALSRADLVVCDCDAVRRVVQSLADVPDDHIVQLPWGTDPDNFRPSPGKLTTFHLPGGPGVRVDTHGYEDYVIPPHYDSLVAKVITHGKDREEATVRMLRALDFFVIEGIRTSIPLHQRILQDEEFRAGRLTTRFLPAFLERRKAVPQEVG